MKKLVRLFSVMLAVFILILQLNGCSKNAETKPEDTSKTSSTTAPKEEVKDVKKVKITVWLVDRHDMDIRKTQVEKFNKENKDGIEIEYEVKSDNFNDVMKLAYQAGTAPDVHTGVPAEFIQNGWLRPFDDMLVQEYKEKFLSGSLTPNPYDGKYYGISINVTTNKFIWNKDLFQDCGLDPEKPPKTWNEVRDYAKIITQKGEGKKFGFALPFKDAIWSRYYIMMPGAASGLYNRDGYDPRTGKFDYSIYKPMLKLFIDIQKDGSLLPTPGTLNADAARAQFAEGNVGMMFGASWDVGVFNDQFPAKIDWGVTDYPSFDGLYDNLKGAFLKGYPSGVGGSSFSMNAKTTDKDKQLIVWKWLISEEVLKELSLAGKGPYSLKSINKPEFIAKDKKGAPEFGTATEPVHGMDLVDTPHGVIKLEGDDVFTTIANIIVAGLDVDKTIDDLDKRYNDALSKAEESGIDIKKYIIPDYDPTTYKR